MGNRSKILIRRSSSDTTACADKRSSLLVMRFPELLPSSPVTTSSESSEKDPGVVPMLLNEDEGSKDEGMVE
ncbi:hypothetical protein Tco_1431965 [Tanacetum coccineum]